MNTNGTMRHDAGPANPDLDFETGVLFLRGRLVRYAFMKERLKQWWPLCKWILAAIILTIIGYRLGSDLLRFDPAMVVFRPGWLLLSALLYIAGIGCSGWYWHQLLITFGQQPRLHESFRAYYVALLGKYVPGKALALIMRGTMIQSERVNMGVAIVAAFYEVLTTMAAGALAAAILFTIQPPQIASLNWNPVYLGLLLLGCVCIPLMPAVFNRLVGGLAKRFQRVQAFQLPTLQTTTLLRGLLLTMLGWFLLGLSLWALLQVLATPPPLTLSIVIGCTAMVSLSYVVGFSILVVPGGIGVREELLREMLTPMLAALALADAKPVASAAAILLRIVWSLAELSVAGVLFWWHKPAKKQIAMSNDQ